MSDKQYTPEEARKLVVVAKGKGPRGKTPLCPHCGHPMPPDEIKGVLQGKQKAIYEVVAKAGALGISTSEIMDAVYGDRLDGGPTWNVLSANVVLINKKIERFGLAVRSTRGWGASCYRLITLGEET